jgi:hypothetical protein
VDRRVMRPWKDRLPNSLRLPLRRLRARLSRKIRG